MLLGDSLSAAHNIPVQTSWPVLLQQQIKSQRPDFKLINASISGETTANGLKRLPALLQQHQPDLTIVELGGNDGLRGLSFKQAQQNLIDMALLAQQAGSKVLLVGVRLPPNYGPVYVKRFQQMFEKAARVAQVDYLPRMLEGVAEKPEWMQEDGIHPNSKAQPFLAKRFREALMQFGY